VNPQKQHPQKCTKHKQNNNTIANTERKQTRPRKNNKKNKDYKKNKSTKQETQDKYHVEEEGCWGENW
jgi:hypothetical protein